LAPADIAKRLGFGELTAPARRVIQALFAYGLVEETTAGRLRVTRLAKHLLQPASEFERDQALVDAADRPGLFHKLNKQFRDRLPDDAELTQWLLGHRLAKDSVGEALRVYRRTTDFVREARRRLAAALATVAAQAEHCMAKRQPSKGVDRQRPGQDELELTDLAWE
jgi:hypothetical protein